MIVFGYAAAIGIGLILGLIGGGGSILTVPVLVYLLGISPVLATAYSLFIVGLTSLFGAFTYMIKREISYKTGAIFAIPSFIAVYFTRKLFVPAIPQQIIELNGFAISKDMAIMLLFSVIMLWASISMIHNSNTDKSQSSIRRFNNPLIMLEGTVVGFFTGLVGAGGGFLIIPALVLLARLPMKLAVGTSLMIIAAKSLIGFIGDVEAGQNINFQFLFIFSIIAIIGILLGSYISKFVSGERLKPVFGWFVFLMGVYIIGKELLAAI
jgi:uncharacterized membrane protein YfcA